MTLRESFANLIDPNRRRLVSAANDFLEATKLIPRMVTPELLLERMSEIDPRYRDLMLRMLQSGNVSYGVPSETERTQIIYTSQAMYSSDPLTEKIVNTWTDFGFGLHVDIQPRDEAAKEAWAEFWDMPENSYVLSQRHIQDLSTQLLVDGDFLFVYFTNKLDGTTKLRVVPSLEIKGGPNGNGIITLPDDAAVPALYRREATINGETVTTYYWDWRLTDEQMAQVEPPEDGEIADTAGTQVRAMLVAHRIRGMRGFPLMTTGFDWAIAYRDILQDRATIVRANAMYLDKLTVKGGQRSIDQIAAKLSSSLASSGSTSETNPRPSAGATWLQNDAVNRERLDMNNTGAADAEKDSHAILAHAGLSGSMYPHWLGIGDSYRLATATSMEVPVYRAFGRYQSFWSSVWGDMATYVLTSYEQFGGMTFEDKDVDISTDSIIDVSFDDISKTLSSLNDAFDRGLIIEEQAAEIVSQLMRVYLQSIGVDEVDTIFEIEPDEQPEPEQPPGPADQGELPPMEAGGAVMFNYVKALADKVKAIMESHAR